MAQSRVDPRARQLSSAEIAVASCASSGDSGPDRTRYHRIESNPDPEDVSAVTVVRAPIGGTITQRQVSPGKYCWAAAIRSSNPVL